MECFMKIRLIILQRIGRVMMGMTTLLTLSSSFASLSTVTPPISYTTRLDVWMVTCIVFVFLTIAEFTLVIILKYYLVNHMPTFCFDRLLRGRNGIQPSHTLDSKEKELVVEDIADNGIGVSYFDLKGNKTSENDKIVKNFEGIDKDEQSYFPVDKTDNFKNTTIDQNVNIPAITKHDNEQYILKQKQQISQHIINIIEKNSVILFLIAFLTFNVIYWRNINTITSKVAEEFESNNFNTT